MSTDAAEMILETYTQCLERALNAMNHAVEITAEQGPAVAIEYIADYLSDAGAIDASVLNVLPEDWLSRWNVTTAGAGDRP